MSGFHLRTLGDLVLVRDSIRIGEARRKPLAVLAYLLVENSHPVNRDALAGMLWPDATPDRARRALTQTLYALRRECHEHVVQGTSQLSIGPGVLGADVLDFITAAAIGDHARALELYRGPFLDGVSFPGAAEFDHWVDRVRRRLAAIHRDVLVASADHSANAKDGEAVLRRLREAHDLYPEDVGITERLAVQYLLSDASHLAHSVIDAFEQRLRNEYELDLPESLQALRRQLAPRDPARADRSRPDVNDRRHRAGSAVIPARDVTAAPAASTPDAPPGPGAGEPHRRRRTPRWAIGAVVGIMMSAAAAVLWWPHATAPQPVTLGELMLQRRQQLLAERRAAIDSTHMGRALILPPMNMTPTRALDSLLPRLSYLAYVAQDQSFAKAVPESLALRLTAEARATRFATSSALQIASMLNATGAALAIQPLLLQGAADSLRVQLVFYRDLSKTRVARRGYSNLESVIPPASGDLDGKRATTEAARTLTRFVSSMETCDATKHLDPAASPWCWGSGRQLRLVPGLDERRRLIARD